MGYGLSTTSTPSTPNSPSTPNYLQSPNTTPIDKKAVNIITTTTRSRSRSRSKSKSKSKSKVKYDGDDVVSFKQNEKKEAPPAVILDENVSYFPKQLSSTTVSDKYQQFTSNSIRDRSLSVYKKEENTTTTMKTKRNKSKNKNKNKKKQRNSNNN